MQDVCWQPGAIPSRRPSKLPEEEQPGDLVRPDETKWSMTIQRPTALLGNKQEIGHYFASVKLLLCACIFNTAHSSRHLML